MWKNLVYNGIKYKNFFINKDGKIKNAKTDYIYKNHINKAGYVVVTLAMGKRGKVKIIRLHKALAETFIPNPNNYKVVHHKDENKTNYSLDNLEWTTDKMNIIYHLQKESKENPYFNNRKLTKENVDFIKNNKTTIPRKTLAKMFNVSKVTIGNVINGKVYNNEVW